jgi:two-component system, LytTR family, sensor kinase
MTPAPPSRSPVWLQLLIGWLPVGVLLAVLVVTAHQATTHEAMFVATRGVIAGVIVCLPLYRLTKRWPWPDRLTFDFVWRQALFAIVFSAAFVLANSVVESVMRLRPVVTVGAGLGPFLVFGVCIYVMVAGILYATDATARAARAEAMAATSRLAALRSQLNPHFLFNALHTVVQLIPLDPALASSAAEEVAALLRTTLEEDRDLVPLAEELAFVRRYLTVEHIRFDERLLIGESIDEAALDVLVPVFAVQTLVENAVRHGAAPQIEPTTITLSANIDRNALIVTVHDDGVGAAPDAIERTTGSGLARLRDRLAALYGHLGRLDVSSPGRRGFTASFTVPLPPADDRRNPKFDD